MAGERGDRGRDRERRRDGAPRRGAGAGKSGSRRANPAARGGAAGQPTRGAGRGGKGGSRSVSGSSKARRDPADRGKRDSASTDRTSKARRDLKGAAAGLPRWVVEELARVTPPPRVAAALEALGEASEAFVDGRHHVAVRKAELAKELAPRDATVREVLGLAAYRVGDWSKALRELRTYRRVTGETTHLPVEMDVLRAQGRDDDVATAWKALQDLGGTPAVMKEGTVVYASFLIDQGDIAEARRLTRPKRLTHEPFPEDLKLWYVAARAAALDGNGTEARDLRNRILEHDPGFPGIDELEELIVAAG